MIATLNGKRHRFCGALCQSAFKMDRARGLIYGPYVHTDPRDGSRRFLSGPGEASMLWRCCAYCGKRATRARATA